jgi:hypothetical protein
VAREALSAEVRWILEVLRSLSRPIPVTPAATGELSAPTLDWDRLLAVAEAEGLAPALAVSWPASASKVAPAAVRDRLRRHLAVSMARHRLLRRELGRLLQAFAREGVPVIPLKGLVLAEMLYPDPVLRPSSDLDLLVRPEAVLAVDGLLRGLGYRRLADDHSWEFDVAYDRATFYAGADGVHVDLHWSLLSDPRYIWNETEGLQVWDRAMKIEVASQTALGLSAEDLLLYLAAHLAVHHGLAGLVWYWDLALILERWADRLDWPVVVARASRWRVRRALSFALRGCEALFGIAAPAAVTARLTARGPRAAVLERLVGEREAERLARLEHLIALLLVDRARDLTTPLAHVICPAPGWVRARYDGAGASLLRCYFAHYRRMVGVGRRVAEGLAGARRTARYSEPARR